MSVARKAEALSLPMGSAASLPAFLKEGARSRAPIRTGCGEIDLDLALLFLLLFSHTTKAFNTEKALILQPYRQRA
jgi:hypothetical protein